MPYTRPDMRSFAALMRSHASRLASAKDAAEASAALAAADADVRRFDTAWSAAVVRQALDTADEYWRGEARFFEKALPREEKARLVFARAVLASPLKAELAERYGDIFIKRFEAEAASFSEKTEALARRENALAARYCDVLYGARIELFGETLTLPQAAPVAEEADAERRHAAWRAVGAFFDENGKKLDDIFDRLAALRTEEAKRLGFGSFTDLAYLRMERCFGREEARRFREAAKRELVPLAEALYKRRAAEAGLEYPLDFADTLPRDPEGDPRAEPGRMKDAALELLRELSPETAEFADAMLAAGAFDAGTGANRAGGGFCAQLPDLGVPFVFANLTGTGADVTTLTHELGHAFATWCARDVAPEVLRLPTMEAQETAAMAMELFAANRAELFFGADAARYRACHAASAVCLIPYAAMVDEFQHAVYDAPELSPAGRHDVWRGLVGEYMPWVRLDGKTPFFGDGRHWQRQSHIYEEPFYYIDYGLAQTAAFGLAGGGTGAYLKFARAGGTETFGGLLKLAGAPTPFEEHTLAAVRRGAEDLLTRAGRL
ncbi:MAG: M3 family oligoendopeptidase, partial [Oscillospiraceae bacterium]|nr:M3 family oligoendopeptidase [Oscillospiraceae bacterium]